MALDIGTSSLRAMLFDEQARAVPGVETQIKYEWRTTPDGGAEFDADEILGYAERAIDELLVKAGDRAKSIVAVASDSLVSNILGVDETGHAVTLVYTYADTRCAREIDELRKRFDERVTHQRVGTLFHTSYQPARFLWLAQTYPDLFKRVRWWMSLGEYFLFRWTGQRACSYSVASWAGLLNRQELAWDKELLAALPITVDQLSPLVDHDQPVGTLRTEYANRWSALRAAKWFPTVGDGAVANVGSGCVDTTRTTLTIGTSSALRVTYPRGTCDIPWGLWSYCVSRELELIGGALSEGGSLFKWMRETLTVGTNIEVELAALEPDAHGLTVLPFLTGERAPNWNADARAAIVGLSLTTKPIEILRAGLESVAYRLGLIFELLRGAVPDARQVIASGGALVGSRVWTQIITDTLGVPVLASAEPEATIRGTALLALKAVGVIDSLSDLPAQTGVVILPDAARHEIYKCAMERQKRLYNRVVGV
ncbi:MAG: gluconokinase [Chloroflexi bacterium]|nr:gluconokinase [Chloroflexota bacterium]